MENIVFFGKGGIGKSTIAANISVLFAASGKKVLHVGCDPKMDSTLALMRRVIRPFTENQAGGDDTIFNSIYESPIKNICCIEAGGPQPGVGCAGTGIGTMLDSMKRAGVMENKNFDTAVFDVLGDVVCGGFAAPLRRGFAKKVVIVTSEEMLSLYSANRLVSMVNNYARNGVYLAGLAVNLKKEEGLGTVETFAKLTNTRILSVILRDAAVTEAEKRHIPASMLFPKSEFAARTITLYRNILASSESASRPVSLSAADFFDFAEGKKVRVRFPADIGAARKNSLKVKSVMAAANIIPSAVKGEQLICDWEHPSGRYKIIFLPLSSCGHALLFAFNDWTVCWHPDSNAVVRPRARELEKELKDLLGRLAPYTMDSLIGCIAGEKDFYSAVSFGEEQDEKENGSREIRPLMAFGQWYRYISKDNRKNAAIPEGSVTVEHADVECRFSDFCGSSFFSGNSRTVPRLPRINCNIVNTDFGFRDSVFGDEAKMYESMKAAAEKIGKGGYMEYYIGCSPIILAGDASAAAARVEKETGVKIYLELYNSFEEYNEEKAAGRLAFMNGKLREVPAPEPGRMKDFFAEENFPKEFGLILERCGLSRLAAPCDFYESLRRARLRIVMKYDMLGERFFSENGITHISGENVFGFRESEIFLRAVCRSLGLEEADVAPSRRQAAELRELRGKAGKYAAAFIVPEDEISVLDPSEGGIPYAGVMAEGGFRVKVFVYSVSDAVGRVAAGTRIKKIFGNSPVEFSFFSDREGLRSAVNSDPAIRLVYSDTVNDERVMGMGKNAVTSSHFTQGYDGMLESVSALLKLCEWRFYERYCRE